MGVRRPRFDTSLYSSAQVTPGSTVTYMSCSCTSMRFRRTMSNNTVPGCVGRKASVYDAPPPRTTIGAPCAAQTFTAACSSSTVPGRTTTAASSSAWRNTSVE